MNLSVSRILVPLQSSLLHTCDPSPENNVDSPSAPIKPFLQEPLPPLPAAQSIILKKCFQYKWFWETKQLLPSLTVHEPTCGWGTTFSSASSQRNTILGLVTSLCYKFKYAQYSSQLLMLTHPQLYKEENPLHLWWNQTTANSPAVELPSPITLWQ